MSWSWVRRTDDEQSPFARNTLEGTNAEVGKAVTTDQFMVTTDEVAPSAVTKFDNTLSIDDGQR